MSTPHPTYPATPHRTDEITLPSGRTLTVAQVYAIRTRGLDAIEDDWITPADALALLTLAGYAPCHPVTR